MEETKIREKEENADMADEKEKNLEIPEKKLKNKKILIAIIVVAIIIILVLIFSTIFAIININNDKIVSGLKIEGIDISGLTRDEAKSKLELVYNEKKSKDIQLKYEDYEASITPELLDVNYEIDMAVDEAISIGKKDNIFINNYNILFALIGKKDLDVNMTMDEENAKKTIEDIGTNLPGAVEESDYYIEESNLIITKGKKGIKIDTDNLLNKIKDNLSNVNTKENYIDIPVIEKNPEAIDIRKIHDEIYKEVQDAYYTKDPFAIHTEVDGIDFNVEEAKTIISAEDKEQYIIPLIITKPKVTTADIGSEAFPDLLATFTTRYDASNVDRTTNLRLACQKINGKVILPEDTFSYNQTLGERTAAAGYKNAKIYENGEVVDGLGGGICQISSTLYNAVLMSNMDIVERRNHQFVTSYVPAGRDATVVYGLTDFKFKNTRNYAIKINASVSSGIATVSIYGIKEENEYTVSFSTRTISTIPYTVKYVEDSTLEVGTEKVKQKGANGIITETYIIKSLNGKVVSTELLSKDTYSAMQKIILKGTKANTKTTTTNVTEKPVTNQNSTENQTVMNKNTQESNNTISTTAKPSTSNKTNESGNVIVNNKKDIAENNVKTNKTK